MPSLKLRQDTVRTLLYVGERAKQQCIYWDEALECFGVRVYPTGRRFYVCSYRFNRRKRLAKLGRVDALTLDEARKKAKRYLAQAANNQDPQEEADRLRTSTMVRELVAAYIEEHAKKKKRTWKEDQSYLKRLLLPAHGARLAVTVESSDIEKIHSGHGAKYPGAANNFLTVARKMFNWARIAGYVPKNHPNPTAGIVRFPERKRKRFVTTVEMPVLLREIEAEENEYARHGLWLLLLTGLRSIELLRSKWESIDWDMRTLFIGLTKNGEPLLAPLSDAAIIRLKMIPRLPDNPYIICGRKRGRPLYGVGTVLRRILKRAGLQNIRVHDLRRTVGSWLAQRGETLHLIGNVLNHRDPKTTAGYAYFQTQQRQAALTAHGEQVTKFSPVPQTEVGDPSYEVTGITELPPEACTAAAPRAHYVERGVLFRLVWEAPVSEVAARLGISDVGLAKICRRASIPIPARGYWAKVEAGVHSVPPSLPPPPPGLPGKVRIKGRQRQFNGADDVGAPRRELAHDGVGGVTWNAERADLNCATPHCFRNASLR